MRLPASYVAFLERFGWACVGPNEVFGLGCGVPFHLDVLNITKWERNEAIPSMSAHLVPILNNGAGDHYCLDTASQKDGECPVVFWGYEARRGQSPQYVAPSFAAWLASMLDEISAA